MDEKIKRSIVDSYGLIITDFFDAVSKNNDLTIFNICLAINTMNRVFEYTILKTKCIEKTRYYSQKSYSYYLEYVEQIHSLYLSQNLNDMDVVLFVYKKTIFDLANDESAQPMNVFTLNYNPLQIEDEELKILLKKIFKLTDVLFYWRNEKLDFRNRQNICDTFLNKFLKRVDNAEFIYTYLEMIQNKILMAPTEYELLLTEYTKKKIKNNDVKNEESFLIKFYVDESILIEKFESGDMKEFLKWLHSPV